MKIKGLPTDSEFIEAKKVADKKLAEAPTALQDVPDSESDLKRGSRCAKQTAVPTDCIFP